MKKIFSVLLFLVVICQIRAEDTNITTMRKMTQRLFPQQILLQILLPSKVKGIKLLFPEIMLTLWL